VLESLAVSAVPQTLHQVLLAVAGSAQFDTPGAMATIWRLTSPRDLERLPGLLENTHGLVVLVVDRGLPWRRASLDLRSTPALCGSIRALCGRLGRETWPAYLLWPSATNPSLALSAEGRAAYSGLRQSGVLGGGRRPLTRGLVRQPLVRTLLWHAAPGAVVVVRPR